MSSIASGYCQELEFSLQSVRLTLIISKRKFCVFLDVISAIICSEWKDSLSLSATVSGAHRKEPVEFFLEFSK